MDIVELVLYSMLSAVLSAMLPSVMPTLVALFAYKRTVHGEETIRRIDRIIQRTGWASSTTVDCSEEHPGNGWHLLAPSGITSPVLAIRSEQMDTSGRCGTMSQYTLYGLHRHALQGVSDTTSKLANKVSVMQYECLLAYRGSTAVHFHMDPPSTHPHAVQKTALKAILMQFKSTGTATALLCGAPGGGKSVCAQYLALEMMKDGITSPTVIQGVDLTSKGLSLMSLLPQVIEEQLPYILVLDEIETAFKRATESSNGGKGELCCLAETKTSLCNELDRIARIPNLIVIGTTNVQLQELHILYPAFTRKGRFDVQISFESEKSE